MKGLFFALLIIIIIAGIAWFAIGFFTTPKTGAIEVPSAKEAVNVLHVINTGGIIYTGADLEVFGTVEGQRVFVCHGYWEISKAAFVYRDNVLRLDEKIFGKIELKKRTA